MPHCRYRKEKQHFELIFLFIYDVLWPVKTVFGTSTEM